MQELKKFEILGLSAETLHALRKKGFDEPTLFQEHAIVFLFFTKS